MDLAAWKPVLFLVSSAIAVTAVFLGARSRRYYRRRRAQAAMDRAARWSHARAVGEGPGQGTPAAEHEPSASPAWVCPRCGAAMVPHVGRRGHHRGKHYLRCSIYPRCRAVIRLDD